MWFRFMDMHSGGLTKVKPYEHIYIEAESEGEAVSIFRNRFGRDPRNITCSCCGEDYAISDHPSLEQATGYDRGLRHLEPPEVGDLLLYKKGDPYYREHYYLEPGEEPRSPYTATKVLYKELSLEEYFERGGVLAIYANGSQRDCTEAVGEVEEAASVRPVDAEESPTVPRGASGDLGAVQSLSSPTVDGACDMQWRPHPGRPGIEWRSNGTDIYEERLSEHKPPMKAHHREVMEHLDAVSRCYEARIERLIQERDKEIQSVVATISELSNSLMNKQPSDIEGEISVEEMRNCARELSTIIGEALKSVSEDEQ